MRRGPPERLAAWLVTGPAGHLWSALADFVLILMREAYRTLAGAGSRRRSFR